MFSTMAKGRTPWGRPHFRWSDTVKALLVQAGPPVFETWSINVHNGTMTDNLMTVSLYMSTVLYCIVIAELVYVIMSCVHSVSLYD